MSPLAVLLALLFAPLLALVVRRRWMAWVAQQEEVARLVRAISEEATRIETECCSAGTPDAVVGGRAQSRKCAVCYSPTATRCSRCKAVRYCSGKCQIVHWRQGHKEECYPPPVHHSTGKVKVSRPEREQAEERELNNSCLDTDGKEYVNPDEALLRRCTSSESNCSSELFSEDDCIDGNPSANTFGSECSSDSSSCSAFSGPVEPLDDASAIAGPDASLFNIHSDSLVESLPKYTSPASHESAVKVNKDTSTRFSPSEYNPESNISCFINLGQNVSTCQTVEVESQCETTPCDSDYPNSGLSSECQDAAVDSSLIQTRNVDIITDLETCRDDDIQMDAASTLLNLIELPDPTAPLLTGCENGNSSGGSAPAAERLKIVETSVTEARGIEKSGHIAEGKKNDAWSFKPQESSSSSFASLVGHLSSQDKGRSSLSNTSLKIDNSKVSAGLSKVIPSIPCGNSDIKTFSVVDQQIRASKSSRNYSLKIISYPSEKYKMLFPYELFVKLYHSAKLEFRPCGLTNCGNSCYANVVLQCLAFTPALTSYLLEGLHTKTCAKKGWCFTCEFEILLAKAKHEDSPISPIGIISQIKNIGKNLGRWSEEDAHEFLRYAIDAIQSSCLLEAGLDVLVPIAAETVLIQLIFGGYLQSKIRCMRCWGKSEQCERIMDLTVEIHGDLGTLEEALARFTATEILDGENKYLCSRCNSYEQAEKKLTILEAPNVLTIALKRYQCGKYGKINKRVLFSENLNLAPYMSGSDVKPLLYSLYAVVVHLDIMNSSFSGHYICYVKNPQGKWYETNDSVVKPVDLCAVLTKDAYMLFYARCSPECPSFLREVISEDRGNIKKCKSSEAIPSSHCRTQKAKSMHCDDSDTCIVFDKGSHSSRSLSFSGNSSRFSSTGKGSSSSGSVEHSYSEYLFGKPDRANRTSLSIDSDELACTENPRPGNLLSDCRDFYRSDTGCDGYTKPRATVDAGLKRSMSHSVFYSDRTAQCRELTEQGSSRETDRTNTSETRG